MFLEIGKFKSVGMGEFDEVSRVFSLPKNENYFNVVDYTQRKISGFFSNLFTNPNQTAENEATPNRHRFLSIVDDQTKTIDDIIRKFPQNSNYSTNYFYSLIDSCINLINKHNESEKVTKALQSFILTNLYIIDFVFYACCRAIKCFESLQENYLAQSSLELKLEELESILRENFSKLCTGLQSEKLCSDQLVTITVKGMKEFLVDKVMQLLHKLFVSDPEHGSMYSSRASLQLSILKDLAQKKDFQAYISYIQIPFTYINTFIQRSILEYSQRELVLSNLLTNISQSISDCRHLCTTALSQGSCNDWKQHFHDTIIKFVRGVKLSDLDILDVYAVVNYQQFSELFEQSLRESIEQFNWETWIRDVLMSNQCNELQEKIANTLVECKALCPFCCEPCQLSAGEHEHYCGSFHRPQGVSGWHYDLSCEIAVEECTTDIRFQSKFIYKGEWYDYVNYRSVNEYFNSWKILGEDSIESKYWQWVLFRFHAEFVQYYEVVENDTIKEWSDLTEEEVIDDIEKHYQNYIFKTID